MQYAIVYSSITGNTKLLAETIKNTLNDKDCLYFGKPDAKALDAELIYIGFWTSKGQCDQATADFLKQLTNQKVFLFGTAGFGVSQEYFEQILKRTAELVPQSVEVIGSFACQGKMPMHVLERYQAMANKEELAAKAQMLIDNFNQALDHPNTEDLEALQKAIKK